MWLIELKGHEFDLEILSNFFVDPTCHIIKEKNLYYFFSEKLSSIEEPAVVLTQVHLIFN